jgi:hypothetical protein
MLFRNLSACLIAFAAIVAGCQSASEESNLDEESVTSGEELPPIAELTFQTRESTKEKLVTEISSLRGIGRGAIAAPGDSWPDEVILQLHLRGLESLSVEADGVIWEVNVSSSPKFTVTSRYTNADQASVTEEPIVYVMPDKQSVSTIPLPEGQFFEIVLPRKLFDSNPAEIKLAWVDFYR